MDWNHDPFASADHCKNVVATVNPSQCPTTPLNNLGKVAPENLLHTFISTTQSALLSWLVPSSASSHPSIASRTFARTSSTVSPWDTHPGNAGTSAQYPPSSAL